MSAGGLVRRPGARRIRLLLSRLQKEGCLMRNRPIVAGILILTTCASVTAAAEPGPFVAEWHWNKAESTSAAGEAMPREMVLNITSADPAHVVWTLTAVDDKGVRRVQSFTGAGSRSPARPMARRQPSPSRRPNSIVFPPARTAAPTVRAAHSP